MSVMAQPDRAIWNVKNKMRGENTEYSRRRKENSKTIELERIDKIEKMKQNGNNKIERKYKKNKVKNKKTKSPIENKNISNKREKNANM